MIQRNVVVKIPVGLHVYPAMTIANTASKYDCQVKIYHHNQVINGSSLLNLVAGAIKCGEEVRLECDGRQEAMALVEIQKILEDRPIAS